MRMVWGFGDGDGVEVGAVRARSTGGLRCCLLEVRL
jgi:hypothetical protein